MFTWTNVSARTSLGAAIIGFGGALALHLASFFAVNESLPLWLIIIYGILLFSTRVAASGTRWGRQSSTAPPPLPEPVSPIIAWLRTHLAVDYLFVVFLWGLAPLWVYLTYWAGLEQPPAQQQIIWVRVFSALGMGLYLFFFLDVVQRGQRKTAQT